MSSHVGREARESREKNKGIHPYRLNSYSVRTGNLTYLGGRVAPILNSKDNNMETAILDDIISILKTRHPFKQSSLMQKKRSLGD